MSTRPVRPRLPSESPRTIREFRETLTGSDLARFTAEVEDVPQPELGNYLKGWQQQLHLRTLPEIEHALRTAFDRPGTPLVLDEPSVRIPLAELRRVLDVLVRQVEAQATEGRVAVADPYWSVPPAEAADLCAGPAEPTLGMVSESWEHLERMVGDESCAVGYGFVWLGDVLRAIGAEVV
ncbi:hypothetical protein OG196_30000 [Kitasatospora purpeofusca]|uniref:hypothetical protein n=1 Tax=Kitasatospora purpeofusca TaxID=67352 RepID=UPI002E0D20A7|nr:hypothetical protein OG196_30000 [Kitasatospora purpeofusca]